MEHTNYLWNNNKQIAIKLKNFYDKSGFLGAEPLNVAGKKRGFRGEKNPLTSRGSCLP